MEGCASPRLRPLLLLAIGSDRSLPRAPMAEPRGRTVEIDLDRERVVISSILDGRAPRASGTVLTGVAAAQRDAQGCGGDHDCSPRSGRPAASNRFVIGLKPRLRRFPTIAALAGRNKSSFQKVVGPTRRLADEVS